MQIGCLGDIVFSVSPSKIETIKNLKQSVSASYSEHKRHNSSDIVEYTGRPAEEISFSVVLSQELGINVSEELEKFKEYTQNGTILRFILGKQEYGSGKWIITSYSASYKYFDRKGIPTMAELDIKLKEYCETETV